MTDPHGSGAALPDASRRALSASRAELRREQAALWLRRFAANESLVVMAPTLEAAARMVRAAGGSSFGRQRTTLDRFAAALATLPLARRGLLLAAGTALEAVAARAVAAVKHELRHHREIADRPGFPRALARTLAELRLAGVAEAALAAESPELALLLTSYRSELAASGLCDRADALSEAVRAVDGGHALAG